ncbi:hypothetical protein [Halomicrobium salinisoli]|uniref:hypothetical protein n=1 Tax=Halomicrobium salinisoli TaxID=2878391 RepID=UPI001CF0184D|nr:hypothetical protein [Halomicrobium salinisoli]
MQATSRAKEDESIADRIAGTSLPSEATPLLTRYAEATRDRDTFLWQWLYHVLPSFRLSSVPDRYASEARAAKFYYSFYMTVVDDLCERHGDRATFQAGRSLPFDGEHAVDEAAVDDEYLALLEDSWDLTESHLTEAPRFEEFRELVEFDLRQSLNTMDYNRLVNERPELINKHGADVWDSYNMLLFNYVDFDLVFSPAFDRRDLAALRELTGDAQRLPRIANWVTTWERELREDDYTSKVVVEAIRRDVVRRDELRSSDSTDAVVERIGESDVERDLLLAWNRTYRRLTERDHGIDSVDVDAFLDGMRYLLEVDVKVRGRK